MAVKIRLTRIGKRNQPLYRLVAIDEHKKRDGRAIEILGAYNPDNPDNLVEVKKDRVDYWLSVGAKPSDTVKHLLKLPK
ncbi:30S ribosomal protein S16 [Candidatus Microgenomates bacterium]|nr:30S ribosomal protein S16 [Candidatus Microgenomates bacterium]